MLSLESGTALFRDSSDFIEKILKTSNGQVETLKFIIGNHFYLFSRNQGFTMKKSILISTKFPTIILLCFN